MKKYIILIIKAVMPKISTFFASVLAFIIENIYANAVKYFKKIYRDKEAEKKTEAERELLKDYENNLKNGVSEDELIKSTEDFLNGKRSN